MAKLGSVSGKVKLRTGSELSADRYEFISLDNVEPNIGNPTANNALMSSDADGTRKFIVANGAIEVVSNEIDLTDTGVTASTYGSKSEIPVLTIDAQGRVTAANTAAIAGIESLAFDANTGVISIGTSANTTFTADLKIGVDDDLTVTSLNTDYVDLSPSANVAYQEGRIFYDSSNKALAVYNDEADVTLQVGQEEWLRVYNNTGSTISDAVPVTISGAFGGFPTVALADATTYDNAEVVGITTHAIENNTYGYVTTRGIVRGIDTSALTAGQSVHVGVTAGTLQTAEPTYPYWATEVGTCLVSSNTAGEIYVNVEHYGKESLRTEGDARVGGDLTVAGDLTVLGTQSTVAVNNLSVDNNFIYLNSGDTIGASGTSFTGTGLNDAVLVGHYTGTTSNKTFYVRISGVGTGAGGVDQFEWSLDNFSTTEATGIDITGAPQALVDGISVEFNATTGHTASDVWSGSASPVNVDVAFIGNRNTGATGPGYTHIGIVFDTADNKWKIFDRYDDEPEGDIDASANTFTLATLVGDTFEGDLTGNVTGNVTGNLTGNADTATKLANARTINIAGDATGNTTFDGSANVTITVDVNDSSNLNSQAPSYYLDYNNFTNTPTIGNGTITVTANSGLSGTGTFALNDTTNTSISISHGDTSSFANTANSGRTYIQNISVDEFGHIQSVTTSDETVIDTTYALDGSGNTDINTVWVSLIGSDTSNDSVEFVGAGSTTVDWDEVNQRVTITSDNNTDNYVDSASFDANTGLITLGRTGTLNDLTVDISTVGADYQVLSNKPVEWSLKTDIPVSGVGAQVLDAFAVGDYTTVKYIIEMVSTATTPNSLHCLEVLLTHDTVDVYMAQYGEIISQSAIATGITADILAGQVRLLISDTVPNNVSVRVTRINV